MHKITFSTATDLVFDYKGVYTVSSGTAPHNPNQARVVFRNADTSGISYEEKQRCINRADTSQDVLEKWVKENFTLGERVSMAL